MGGPWPGGGYQIIGRPDKCERCGMEVFLVRIDADPPRWYSRMKHFQFAGIDPVVEKPHDELWDLMLLHHNQTMCQRYRAMVLAEAAGKDSGK
jgi:hypothetical protein